MDRGWEALDRIHVARFDLVISALRLDDMRGVELLRAAVAAAHLPVDDAGRARNGAAIDRAGARAPITARSRGSPEDPRSGEEGTRFVTPRTLTTHNTEP